jgi:hypothetical protein
MSERTLNVLSVVLGVVVVVLIIMDWPPATWINQLQVRIAGGYHPKLTALILILGVIGLYVVAWTIIHSVGEAVDDPIEKDRLARQLRRDADEVRR